MGKEIVIDAQHKQISIALMQDSTVVELHRDTLAHSFTLGNIYLGRVKKLMAGLNAAFVDIGCDKEAFIHYHDLGSNFNSFNNYVGQLLNDRKREPKYKKLPMLEKDGNISSVLKQGDFIMCQIVKESINTKGPRLTGEISIAGRNMVLLPLGEKVSVSQKIKSNEERTRLRKLLNSIKASQYGLIVRTVAEGKKVAELDGELRSILKRWEKTVVELRKSKGVAVLHEESGRVMSIIRDLFTPDFENIHVNDSSVYDEILAYVDVIAPEKKKIVQLYTGEQTIFDNFDVTRQIKSLFGRTISFKRGAYLIMEQTEAMHVIDVNSGNRTKADQTQEENAIEVNMAAATEIARQLRLRDLGGIVVVDFIDMGEQSNRQKLYEYMTQLMSTDRARHNILPLSKFGLMQITRQRVRPAMAVDVSEVCPVCKGTGKATPSLLLVEELENKIDTVVHDLKIKKFTVKIHPFIASYINRGFIPMALKWKFMYSFGMKMKVDESLGLTDFVFLDEDGDKMNPDAMAALLQK